MNIRSRIIPTLALVKIPPRIILTLTLVKIRSYEKKLVYFLSFFVFYIFYFLAGPAHGVGAGPSQPGPVTGPSQ